MLWKKQFYSNEFQNILLWEFTLLSTIEAKFFCTCSYVLDCSCDVLDFLKFLLSTTLCLAFSNIYGSYFKCLMCSFVFLYLKGAFKYNSTVIYLSCTINIYLCWRPQIENWAQGMFPAVLFLVSGQNWKIETLLLWSTAEVFMILNT